MVGLLGGVSEGTEITSGSGAAGVVADVLHLSSSSAECLQYRLWMSLPECGRAETLNVRNAVGKERFRADRGCG